MSDVAAFALALHHVDEKHADDSPVVGPGVDEGSESLVYLEPDFTSVVRVIFLGSVVVDEVVSVGLSIDGEQPGRGEPVTQSGAIDAVVHDVDEEADDVSSVVGVVFDNGGYGHGVVAYKENICSYRNDRRWVLVGSRGPLGGGVSVSSTKYTKAHEMSEL